MKKLTIKHSTLTEQITPFGGATVWSIQLFDENDNVVTVQTGKKEETMKAAAEIANETGCSPRELAEQKTELLEIVRGFQEALIKRVSMKPEPEYLEWFVELTRKMNSTLAAIEKAETYSKKAEVSA